MSKPSKVLVIGSGPIEERGSLEPCKRVSGKIKDVGL